jgi:glycosyltransferase involved in cell wall biosynthesis
MNILIVTTNLPRWKGDFRVPFILEAAKAVNGKGHHVRVLTMHNPGSAEHEWIDGIEIFRIRYLPEKHETLQKDAAGIPAAWDRGFASRLKLLPFFIALVAALPEKAKGFDLIHANWSLAGLAAVVTKPFHRLPVITTVQGSDIYKVHDKPIIRSAIRFGLRSCARVIALSTDLAKSVEAMGIQKEKIVVIPNGINICNFPMGEQTNRLRQVLYVGSLVPRKGVKTLIEAMAKVHDKFPDAHLLVVGEGDQRTELENLVRQFQLEGIVFMLGTKSQAEVSILMRESKLFVLPSIEEGQGVVLVEALASGTPCVGSRVGGIPDVITPEVGQIVEAQDVEELACAIESYMENDTVWRKASQKARERVKNEYNWYALAEKIIAVYQSVLDKDRI